MEMKNMKYIGTFMIISSLIILFTSCDKDIDKEFGFYNAEYRKGLWIIEDKSDTLESIDNFNLIRKGTNYSREEYSYLIEQNTLVITLNYQNEEIRTQHPILKVDKSNVQLANMYPITGAGEIGDNS